MKLPIRSFLLAVSLPSAAGLALLASPTVQAGPTADDAVVQATRLASLPADLHRRAVDVLEERRDLIDSPWVDASFRDAVVPMFRPGETAPAYVELTVEGPDGQPRGFMVLSTGEHDHPIVHLAHEGPAPSARLQHAAGEGTLMARVYRLSYDAYVAEDARGRLLAVEGHLPGKLEGYDPAWLESSAEARSGSYRWDPSTGVVENRPAIGDTVRFDAWPSWKALRAEYADNYAPLHAVDRLNAADDWEAERLLARNGGTLQNGEFRELPLLAGRGAATYTVTGGGASAVRTELAERLIENDMALRVFVDTAPVDEVVPVDLHVRYADGTTETLRLNVTDRIPGDVLGAMGPATSGSVSERVSPLDAPGLACSKAVLVNRFNAPTRVTSTAGLSTTGPWRTDDALFRIEYSSVGKVAFRAANGKYVRAVGGGGGAVVADAAAKGSHEWFTVYQDRQRPEFYGLQTADRRHFVRFHWEGQVDARATRSTDGDTRFKVDYCEPRRLFERWAGKNPTDAAKKVRKYDQLGARMAPSNSQCASGCGATAWAMLFGFHDYEAALGVPKWVPHKGLFKKDAKTTGPDATAPEWFWNGTEGKLMRFNNTLPHKDPAAMVWEISQIMNDWTVAGCSPTGEKWTAPVLMGKAHIYLDRRNVKATLVSDYDGASIMTHEGKTKAYAVIKTGQPVVIGIGHLSHYPLAVGRDRSEYRVWERNNKRWSGKADRRHFVVHMGFGGPHLEVVPYGTWMAGSLAVADVLAADATPAQAAPTTTPPTVHQTDKNLNPKTKPIAPTPTANLPKKGAHQTDKNLNPKTKPIAPTPTPTWNK